MSPGVGVDLITIASYCSDHAEAVVGPLLHISADATKKVASNTLADVAKKWIVKTLDRDDIGRALKAMGGTVDLDTDDRQRLRSLLEDGNMWQTVAAGSFDDLYHLVLPVVEENKKVCDQAAHRANPKPRTGFIDVPKADGNQGQPDDKRRRQQPLQRCAPAKRVAHLF